MVTGLSGGGKASILHALEDAGYDTIDNPPLGLLEDLATRADRDMAIGVDTRTRGFNAELVLDALHSLRRNPALLPELVFAWADEETLLRRYTETRRRHPLAPRGRVAEGIEVELEITARLRDAASLVIDTSNLPLARLRRLIERQFGPGSGEGDPRMVVSLVSFAYSKGLPKEADLVFDARFLRNPHYDPILRPRTGLDPGVGDYICADPDYAAYLSRMIDLIDLVLPRFVQEGKKYATLAIGCTGGRHRSVYLAERLAAHLSSRLAVMHAAGEGGLDWRQTVTHRELGIGGQGGGAVSTGPVSGDPGPGDSGTGGPDGGGTHPAAPAVGTMRNSTQGSGDKSPGASSSSGQHASPDAARHEVQADGDGQKPTPVQAQEA